MFRIHHHEIMKIIPITGGNGNFPFIYPVFGPSEPEDLIAVDKADSPGGCLL